ncbi:hypothetical protein BDN70DRAFT_984982 [Pholiota conissans]|uniref:Protein kinase domain-containing protein n=1 Tax=Pholiota conissans TaxID=109636 RepID=A0A9P5Z0G1_9AGAR|nr:hypothetical protein BDN70DRAFT_984982 [Pholiota conissans]
MITAVHDAIKAHDQILDAGIIHRDISVGNIMILENGRGILIDFDLCKRLEDMKKEARASEPTDLQGTWQFMSAKLQTSEIPLHPVRADDLESFLHVISWIALRYVPSELSAEDRTGYLTSVFDSYRSRPNGMTVGGPHKRTFLTNRTIVREGKFEHGPLLSLLEELTETCAARYEEFLLPLNPGKLSAWKALQIADHKERLERLATSEWIIDLFAEYLKSPLWPKDDKAVENPLLPKIEESAMELTFHTQTQSTIYSERPHKKKNLPYGKVHASRGLTDLYQVRNDQRTLLICSWKQMDIEVPLVFLYQAMIFYYRCSLSDLIDL